MKLSDVRVDSTKVEQGEWIGEKYGTPIPDMSDFCVKVRGINNADWRKLQERLQDAVPRKKRVGGRVAPDERDRITQICLRECCLLDWDNFEGDGVIGAEDGTLVPYDKKLAERVLNDPDYRRVRDAVLWAAMIVGEQDKAEQEEIAGN